MTNMKVELLDFMGDDLAVVNAARVSFHKESWYANEEAWLEFDEPLRVSKRDAKLIHYLARHGHWTPFGHCTAKFRIKAPIFVARQLVKHQVGLVWNEVSRRYVDAEPEFYIPDAWRKRAEDVKQGSSDETIPVDPVGFQEFYGEVSGLYWTLLDAGVCPEMARMVLPASLMTEWIWTGSLAAFARVCALRCDSHSQEETRRVAEMISAHMRELFPVSWDALTNREYMSE